MILSISVALITDYILIIPNTVPLTSLLNSILTTEQLSLDTQIPRVDTSTHHLPPVLRVPTCFFSEFLFSVRPSYSNTVPVALARIPESSLILFLTSPPPQFIFKFCWLSPWYISSLSDLLFHKALIISCLDFCSFPGPQSFCFAMRVFLYKCQAVTKDKKPFTCWYGKKSLRYSTTFFKKAQNQT